jgi:hypothetical protein
MMINQRKRVHNGGSQAMKFVKMGLGFIHSVGPIGKVITWVTTPLHKVLSKKAREACPTHVFVWFEDDRGTRIYYEALEGEGFQGPFPVSKYEEWVREDDRRWVETYDLTKFLGLSAYQISTRKQYCDDMLDYWDYNTPQLILQLRTMGLGRKIIPASPRDVICSEAGARICRSDLLDFTEWCKKRNPDDISPRVLYDAVKKMVRQKDK